MDNGDEITGILIDVYQGSITIDDAKKQILKHAAEIARTAQLNNVAVYPASREAIAQAIENG